MANNMTVSDKNMTRKQQARAIINRSVGHVSQKDIHVRIVATAKTDKADLRKKREVCISKLRKKRVGGGVAFIGDHTSEW